MSPFSYFLKYIVFNILRSYTKDELGNNIYFFCAAGAALFYLMPTCNNKASNYFDGGFIVAKNIMTFGVESLT
jgi:hypothetical protein